MIYTKENFTVADLLEVTKDCNENAYILNSNYTLDSTQKQLEQGAFNFEAILDLYDEGYEVIVNFSWGDDYMASRTLRYFREFSAGLKNKDIPLNRDVEDGYKFANYDNIVYNENYIVLC